jgi:hypothetical protein
MRVILSEKQGEGFLCVTWCCGFNLHHFTLLSKNVAYVFL